MKILVVGSGVIGTTYGWQLSIRGNEMTHFIRGVSAEAIEKNGIPIRCLDLRGFREKEIRTVYRPVIVKEIPQRHDYELIIVPVNSHQLAGVLPLVKARAGGATVMVLQNIRPGDEDLIARHLEDMHYLIGYPFKTGGGRDENGIDTVIFGNFLSNTKLGEPGGKISPKLRAVAKVLGKAGMKPRITRRIITYVRTHYVWAAASLGAFAKAGSWDAFTGSPSLIRESYLAMREGFRACRAKGMIPWSVSPTWMFYLPLFLLVPFTKIMYRNEPMRRMFEGHVAHSPEEMRVMYLDVLEEGRVADVPMPVYEGFSGCVENFLKNKSVL